MTKIILQTKRLKIAIPSEDSLNNRYQLLSDPEVSQYLGDGKPKIKQQVAEFLQKNISHYEAHGFCLFDVFDQKTGEFIGDAGLIYEGLNSENDDVEVGYRLLKKYWGKGYATELTKAFIEWGFAEFKLPKIVAFCYPENIASSNVMKKCGMKYGGEHLYDGKNSCVIYDVKNIVITTENFYLRPFHEKNDFELSYNLWNDKNVLKSMECPPCSKDHIKEKLARYKFWMDRFGFTNFAIFTKDSDEFVGSCGMSLFHNPDGDRNPLQAINSEKYLNRDVELGYVLHEKYWGKGHASELAQSCVDFVFNNNPDISRIVAVTVPSNIASQKILSKAGFKFIGDVNSKEYGKEKFFTVRN